MAEGAVEVFSSVTAIDNKEFFNIYGYRTVSETVGGWQPCDWAQLPYPLGHLLVIMNIFNYSSHKSVVPSVTEFSLIFVVYLMSIIYTY